MDIPNSLVVLMGIGTVFFGLICIIVLSYVMSAVCRTGTKAAPAVAEGPAAAPAQSDSIPNRQAMVAAIAAAVAEDLGTDPAGIRILSLKKL